MAAATAVSRRLASVAPPLLVQLLLPLFATLLMLSSPAEARNLSAIQHSGELRLCVTGLQAERYAAMGRVLAESLGVRAAVRRLERWQEQFKNRYGGFSIHSNPKLLESGECDLFPNDLLIPPWRQKGVALVPLFTTRMMVVLNSQSFSRIKQQKDLAGMRGVVPRQSCFHNWLQQLNRGSMAHKPIKLQFLSTHDALLAVGRGEADFTLLRAESLKMLDGKKYPDVVPAFPVGLMQQASWALHRQDHDLQSQIRSLFTQQTQHGSQFDHIWQRHVGVPLSSFRLYIATTVGGP
uniref:Uncharacterized protein n=1 Tax=Magnetococcus massalia (strain MO-1) TaxID=451514 RepID=A0A1S7LER4_MAGMO|nr:conserved exported protein of unknown function [Candidatus Magnetococcus massalia]